MISFVFISLFFVILLLSIFWTLTDGVSAHLGKDGNTFDVAFYYTFIITCNNDTDVFEDATVFFFLSLSREFHSLDGRSKRK